MNVGELKDRLEDYGNHLPVVLALGGADDEWRLAEVEDGSRSDEDDVMVPTVILVSEAAE